MNQPFLAIPESFSLTPFEPAQFATGPHAQTILANKLRPTDGLTFKLDKIDTPDDDFLVVEYATNAAHDPIPADAPVLLCLHGLEGHAKGVYMLETYRQALKHGLRPVGLNYRTCGDIMNQTWQMYNAGATDDVALTVNELLKQFPDASSINIVGFSLGGNMLVKYLGEGRELPSKLMATAAVSPPFDMNLGIQQLLHGMGWFYGFRFLRTLKRKARLKADLIKDRVDLDAVLASKTLFEFDDVGTSQLYGYKNAEDYYNQCGCGQFLDRVTVPTLLIRSLDDPFMDPADIPYDTIEQNPNLYAAITETGGHVGFMQAGRHFWGEETAVRFVDHVLKNMT